MLLYIWEFARLARKLTPLFSADPRRRRFLQKSGLVTPLESALPDTPLLSPLECAVLEKGGRGYLFTAGHSPLPIGNNVGASG